MFKNINNILLKYYGIKVYSIGFLSRKDLDYSVLNSRKVLIVNDNYILKISFEKNLFLYLNYIFDFLKEKSCDNVIYPILTLSKNNTLEQGNITYLFFNKYNLLKNLNIDSIIIDYLNFIVLLNKMDKYKLGSSNSYYLSMLKLLKNKDFLIFLNKNSIEIEDFKYYISKYLKNKKTGIIYATFWEGNIYFYNGKNIFLDIDSIREGDPFYDMCFVLLYVYLNKNNIDERYNLYNKILLYYIDNFGIINKEYIKGLLYYFCFFIFKDIKEREPYIVFKHISINLKFMTDFLKFYKYDF